MLNYLPNYKGVDEEPTKEAVKTSTLTNDQKIQLVQAISTASSLEERYKIEALVKTGTFFLNDIPAEISLEVIPKEFKDTEVSAIFENVDAECQTKEVSLARSIVEEEEKKKSRERRIRKRIAEGRGEEEAGEEGNDIKVLVQEYFGPKLVVFSGGTAFNSVVKHFTTKLSSQITHVLPVSDNGGSSRYFMLFYSILHILYCVLYIV